jgi:hypothetical protein
MSALILSAMLCSAAAPDPDRQEKLDVIRLVAALSQSVFVSAVKDVARGKKPPVKLIKPGIDLAVAYESRIECWLFGSTELLHVMRGFLENR